MSISSALSSAVSGLTASARAADVASSNLANVLTEGYAPRSLELETLGYRRPGVRVTGIVRNVDDSLVADRRQADAALAFANTRADFVVRLQSTLGTPENAASLSGRMAAFEASLVAASNAPENTVMLQDVVVRAQDLTRTFNAVSDEIQSQRTEAESRIAQTVSRVNTLLENIQELNAAITTHAGNDHHAAALLDHRQAQIDELAALIPVQQVPRGRGAVALFTPGGAVLIDGNPARLDFTASNVVAPHMTLGNGLLSGLTINGVSVPPSGAGSPVQGGQLSALFSVRDDLAVDAQTQVDALARNMLERVQQAGLDPTTSAGDPGLFTDSGAAFNPLNEVGVAGRIELNLLVDPDQGGAVWRLRDGLGAALPGPPGNAVLLSGLAAAINDPVSLASGNLGGTARDMAGHLATFNSQLGGTRLSLDQSVSFASARQTELVALELENGVDTDAELQRLLLIEQAYAANARMIETVEEMMNALLRI